LGGDRGARISVRNESREKKLLIKKRQSGILEGCKRKTERKGEAIVSEKKRRGLKKSFNGALWVQTETAVF